MEDLFRLSTKLFIDITTIVLSIPLANLMGTFVGAGQYFCRSLMGTDMHIVGLIIDRFYLKVSLHYSTNVNGCRSGSEYNVNAP